MCDLLLLSESFARIFPTHNFGGSISHGARVGTDELPFLLFGNDIPCFPRLLGVSAGVISIPAMAAHSNN